MAKSEKPNGSSGRGPSGQRPARPPYARRRLKFRAGAWWDGDFWFDDVRAAKAVAFFPDCLRHVKGEWAGQPFVLEPWERDIVAAIFGWKREDGMRRFRTVYIEIPRKNFKSTLAAGIALLLLFADGEPGAEVYSAAADSGQAQIVFKMAKRMIELSPTLSARAQPFRNSILFPETASSYQALSADVPTKHGINAHGIDSNAWDGGQPDTAQAYVEAGFHVLVFDLRGHGRSGGERLGLGWLERRDVRAAVNLLLKRGFKPGRIGIHGTSYGSATALLSTAAIPEVGAVVADSAFADIRDIMDAQIEDRTGIPAWVARLFLRPGNAFVARVLYSLDLAEIPPERAVPDIAPRPILFIHGSDDPTITVEHAYRLKAASKNPADELWVLEGYGHTEGVRLGDEQIEVSPLRDEFLRKVTEFFVQSLR